MSALLDADAPGLGSLTVGLVRFKAGDPAQRQGTIFFNFGGPGGNPLDFLPGTGYLWSTRSLDHPLDGDKRRLADRYDLVAVIPRGLRGGTRFACRSEQASDGHDPTVDLADWNWDGFVKDAKAYAAGCALDPLHPHVGTLQHVRDMEQARLALHEPVLNFVGISYGTWVGAFYAAAHPTKAGRIVLDSVMNYAGTFEGQVAREPYERQAFFTQAALLPALAAPAKYGIGTNADEVLARLRDMPHRAREAWASAIDTPAQLVAALTMADWVRIDGEGKRDRLLARIEGHAFSTDTVVDGAIRAAAIDFTASMEGGRVPDPVTARLVDFSVYDAVVCGDTPWRSDAKSLRAMANHIAARYPAASGDAVTIGLTCVNWPTGPRWRPPMTELAKAPPMLLIQAEFDPATPLRGAFRAFSASTNTYMVVARDMKGHGVFGMSATPCVERAVGRFLLDGELPEQRLSGCDFVPASPSRYARDAKGTRGEGAVRDELARRLRES
ncbi:alpha/beta hydrolase family protein [Luteibacter sp. OK325]|uniref:alpha/beta hydrolase n=1 Tax=Luteibacter sp. OK325 TaxID=2135670 RepID=UPI000D40156F|nr:alpha/beta hydrolase [Luteibacter sp. OK325]PTR35481.1 alpha/beta hydrolase family protein [Luteibacter sp. OK325]